MDMQLIGLSFAVLGVIATVVWFLFLRRGLRAVERASAAVEYLRDQLGRLSDKSKQP